MITFTNPYSQMAVAETIAKHEKVGEWILNWLRWNQFPRVCLTPEEQRDSVLLEKWKWTINTKPDRRILAKIELFVSSLDTDPETGITKEISFVWYHRRLDEYDRPVSDWVVGCHGIRNGALVNLGTDDKPNWSIHT